MNTPLLVGCCGYPGNPQRYQRELPLVELQRTFRALPRLKTAKRWREAAPSGFAFALRAWQGITHTASSPTYRGLSLSLDEKRELGHFQKNAIVDAAWDRTRAIAVALKARALVFESPYDFTPTREHRHRLASFFERLERPGDTLLVWDPRGVWDKEESAAIARDLDLVLCSDGQEELDDERNYVKVRDASLGGEDIERLARRLSGGAQTLVVLQTNDAFAWARRLWRRLAEEAEDFGSTERFEDSE